MTDKSIPLYSLLKEVLQNIMESKLDETEWLSARSIRTRIQA